ncbi:MAG: TonB-dependent receptor [Rikenellaceae bacterium]
MRNFKLRIWKYMLFLIVLFLSGEAYAQNTITGVVTSAKDGSTIIGATVIVQGTTMGATTGVDGDYSISAAKGAVLEFSYIGYEPQTVTVSAQTVVNVALEESSVMIEEVVAIGYGVQKKKELTGAVSQVKSDELLKSASSDFTKALQGKVSGLTVLESSGRPGDGAVIQIRGLGSISGSSEPLYVVDGIPYDSNPNIPSEEIASVDVLKDGASAAVYGTRASNGVILITTKRGDQGEMKVSFTGYYGIQNITSGTPLLNTEQHIYVDEMYYQMTQGVSSPILYYNPNAMDYETDWVGDLTNNNAPVQSYNISLSGGSEGTSYSINTNYYQQDGILINSGYDRLSTRANATMKKGKFDAFVSLGVSMSNQEQEPWNLYQYAVYQGPYRQPLAFDGANYIYVDGNNVDHVGYIARLINQTDYRKENSYNLAANLKYEIIDGLTYQANIGYNYWQFKRDYFLPQYMVYDSTGSINASATREDASLTQYFYGSNKVTLENVLNYQKQFGKHGITALLGYTVEKSNWYGTYAQKQDFMSNDTQVFDAASSLTSIGGTETVHTLVGKLARIQYNYDDKYMISASGRYDGSSRMSEENRYAFFPGVSAGWNISEENFMESANWLSSLKLRGSYGEVGNENIGNYGYASYVSSNVDYVWGAETSDELGLGAIQRSYSNADIKWETNVSRNIGIDAMFLDNALTLTFDVYKNDKKDMLLDVTIPASTGTNVGTDNNTITSNVGNMTNTGFEIAASYKGMTQSGFSWSVTGTFSRNENEVTSLGGMDEIALEDSMMGAWCGSDAVTAYMKVGYPAGSFFLIQTDGVIQTQEELDEVKTYQPNALLGDLKMIDENQDGQIDDSDRVYMGSGQAKFETSLVFNAAYKGFDFSTQLFYSYGAKIIDGAKQFAYSANRHADFYDMWTPANPTSNIPTPNEDNCSPRLDYFLSDGTYLRVRNITLGYTLPKSVVEGVVDNARVYFSAQNPFTFTEYEGFDPEVGGDGTAATRGVDAGNYPITRKFMLGVQIDF